MDYMSSMIEKIIVERNKKVDSAILGEIQKIAVENGIETKIFLNEKNVADALRNYQDGYAAIKAEVAREIVEFLFRRSKSLQHVFKDNHDSAQCFRGRFELENAAVIIANEYGVELKKEYGVTDINVGNKYFTAEQVRAMSREEVRINYWAIMESMKKWGEQK